MMVCFAYGYMGDNFETLESQAQNQGCTLGDKAEYFESVVEAWYLLVCGGFLTNRQRDSISLKIGKYMNDNLKKIEDEK